MAAAAEIKPRTRLRMIDLVREAGADVSDWSKVKGGASNASRNPKYCYEWSFAAGDLVIVNLPHVHMNDDGGTISQTIDLNRLSTGYGGGKAARPARTQRLRSAIRRAFGEELPVRVIVFGGRLGDVDDPEATATRVATRLLDPISWAVTAYDEATGQVTLTRGATPLRFADQFDLLDGMDAAVARTIVTTGSFVRSPHVRGMVLRRANGQCEWCNQPGFTMPNGRVFLETHHVIPLSEGGRDADSNVVGLCANHHREAHYGTRAKSMQVGLVEVIRKRAPAGREQPRV